MPMMLAIDGQQADDARLLPDIFRKRPNLSFSTSKGGGGGGGGHPSSLSGLGFGALALHSPARQLVALFGQDAVKQW